MDPRSEKLQLEGVVTDIANVNRFVKKYDKSVHYILGGPFIYDVKLSSGSILDCKTTPETVLERIETVFEEAREEISTKKGATNTGTVFIYLSGHGHTGRLMFYKRGVDHKGTLEYTDIYQLFRKQIIL